MPYVEPEWAQKPTDEWALIEIKGGMEVAKHNLQQRATSIFGRALDMVHIPVNHESASRQHARIAFDSQGIPWLRDLKSTHGTFCNKRRLPPEVCGQLESNSEKAGSRGIIVYPGDILKFGASTRSYFLEGPPEFERGAMKAKMQQAMANCKGVALRRPEQDKKPAGDDDSPNPESSSWGITMEEDVNDGEEARIIDKTLPMDMEVPDKHRKAFDRLNALKYKLSNLETEDGRIRRKGDLSQGQEKQLQRNAEKEEALKRSIEQLEEALYDKLYPETANNVRKPANSHQDFVDEDDDFFDRTKDKNDDILDSEESEATLVAKWKKIYEQKSHRESNRLPAAQHAIATLLQRLSTLEATGDEEAFFVKNELALAKESHSKILSEQKTAMRNMEEIQKLLKIVNPKLRIDPDSGFIGEERGPMVKEKEEGAVKISTTQTMLPPPRSTSSPRKRGMESGLERFSMPPPMLPSPTLQLQAALPCSSDGKASDILMPPPMPPPKRKRVVGPSMPLPQSSSEVLKPSPSRQSSARQRGTLSFLSSIAKSTTKRPDESIEVVEARESKKTPIDSRKDMWRAPDGQDGSGITKLNAKFGGRY